MAVGGYPYLNFIHFYKSNLEQSPPPQASPTLEMQDKMAKTPFALLAGPPLFLQASTSPTPTGRTFLSIV